jgi:hypothetical protein
LLLKTNASGIDAGENAEAILPSKSFDPFSQPPSFGSWQSAALANALWHKLLYWPFFHGRPEKSVEIFVKFAPQKIAIK